MTKSIKPVALAMLALLGIVVAGNFPPDTAEAAPRMIKVCVNMSSFELFYKKNCPDGVPVSWSATRSTEGFVCVVKESGQIIATPNPPACGAGRRKLSWGTYSAKKKYLTTCVDRRTRKMYVSREGKCGKRLKVRWVRSAPYMPLYPSTTTTTSTSSTIAPSCANGQASCALGDTGPGGGKVFYIDSVDDFVWEYLEAAPTTWAEGEVMNWTCSAEYNRVIPTGTAIGDGQTNTLSMYHEVEPCGDGLFAGFIVPTLEFGGKSDWFIPSIDELEQMANQNASLGLGLDENTTYWSSSQSVTIANMAWGWDFVSDSAIEQTKGGSKVRPIRAFGANCARGGECAIGDIGPGGGRVFYIDAEDLFVDWTYMEMAPSNWNGASELTGQWCNDTTNGIGADSYDIGGGLGNFFDMALNCTGVTQTVGAYVSTHLGHDLGDWFIPSRDELWEAYTTLNDLGYWTGYSQLMYWSSTEFSMFPDNAVLLRTDTPEMTLTTKDYSLGVIPVRSF